MAVHIVKAMFFPIVMYGCESWTMKWTIKKAEHWRTDAFELWCWRRLLRVLWIARRSNRSILKEINPEYSLEGLMLKLKLQYFGHLMQRANSLEKTRRLGNNEGKKKKAWQKMRWSDSIPESMDMGLSKVQEIVEDRVWHAAVSGVTESQTWPSNWTTTTWQSWGIRNQRPTAALTNEWQENWGTNISSSSPIGGPTLRLPRVSQQDWIPLITSLMMKIFTGCLPFCVFLPPSSTKIISQINYLPLNLCLGVCFSWNSN